MRPLFIFLSLISLIHSADARAGCKLELIPGTYDEQRLQQGHCSYTRGEDMHAPSRRGTYSRHGGTVQWLR